MRYFALICAGALATLSNAGGVRIPDITGGAISKPPVVDGTITAEEWAGAVKTDGLLDMETGAATADAAEFFLAYDANFVYVAARLSDPSPSTIKAVEYRTNAGLGGDDHFRFRLDPTGAGAAYNEFFMNANGGSTLQIAGGRAIKREWLGEFFTKGRITETGWEVEARIPWRLMQMPPASKRDMRVNFMRYTSRTQRQSTWAYNGGMQAYHGFWKGVDSPKIPFERTLKLLPFGFIGSDEQDGELAIGGLDFKTSISERIEAVGTVSPDFRNIEGDILSLDFSYFERLPRDNRPFFQEGAGYLEGPVFASQRIDRFDAGMNIYGRLNDRATFGFLNTYDAGNEINSVGTVTVQQGDRTSWRAGFTRNEGDLRPDNTAAFLRWFQTDGPFSYFARSTMSDDEIEGVGMMNDLSVSYNKNGLNASIGYGDATPDFRPRLAFVRERDYRGIGGELEYTKVIPTGPIMEWEIGMGASTNTRYNGTDFYRDEFGVNLSLTMRDGLDFDLGHNVSKFLGSKDRITYFGIEKPRRDPYRRWQFDTTFGEIAGKRYESVGIALLYRPVQKLQTSLRFQTVDHFEKSEQTIFGANYDLGNDMAISGRLVIVDDETGGYFSFRRSGNKGAEYYLIVGNPNSREFEKTIILKAVVPFEIRL